MRAICLEKRMQIVEMLDSGCPAQYVAMVYGVSVSSVKRFKNDITIKKRTASFRKIDPVKLKEDLILYPDDICRDRAVRFDCTPDAISKAIRRLKRSEQEVASKQA